MAEASKKSVALILFGVYINKLFINAFISYKVFKSKVQICRILNKKIGSKIQGLITKMHSYHLVAAYLN